MPIYLSTEAHEEMKRELEHLKKQSRRDIAAEISAAKEFGDLSENFEYQEAKEKQGLNEARIAELENKVRDVVIMDATVGAKEIGIGTSFQARVQGQQKKFSLVGSNETNPLEGKISNESPIGLAFIGRRPGDIVCVETPSGAVEYEILSIE